MNTTLHVKKIQASIDNSQKGKIKIVSKDHQHNYYLRNEVDRTISDSNLMMISIDIVTMSLATDVS